MCAIMFATIRLETKEGAIEDAIHELGLKALKLKQRDATFSLLLENDTLVVLPTGSGKSTAYTNVYIQ